MCKLFVLSIRGSNTVWLKMKQWSTKIVYEEKNILNSRLQCNKAKCYKVQKINVAYVIYRVCIKVNTFSPAALLDLM